MVEIKPRYARQAVRRAAKAFLILTLLVSGAFKLLGDPDIADAFARGGFSAATLTPTGYVQIGLSIVLIFGIADRAVAVVLTILLVLMLVLLAPVTTITILPLGLVLLACAIVFKFRREKAETKEATA